MIDLLFNVHYLGLDGSKKADRSETEIHAFSPRKAPPMINRFTFAAVLTAAALVLPAAAEPQNVAVSVTYAAADLASDVAASEALSRFESEARNACRADQPVTGRRVVDRACAGEALAGIVRQIDAEHLTDAYEARFEPGAVQAFASLSGTD
jgi:UrcA family protein